MADKLYPFVVDAPATVNKSKSLLLPLDKALGSSFRINRLFIETPELDAIAATDVVGVMLSKVEHNEQTTFLESGQNNGLIMKESLDFHLAEAAITNLLNLNDGMVELKNFRGVFLETNQKNYITHLITGQDGAINMNITIEGGYTKPSKEDWNYNTF